MTKGISLWRNGKKGRDYQFQDKIAREHIERSGTGFNVHKYIGPVQQDPNDPTVTIPVDGDALNETSIQDITV